MTKQLHPYKSGEDTSTSRVKEPSLAYVCTNVRDNYLDIVSENMFRNAIVKAVSNFDNGMVLPHSKIDELVKTRMGWK